MKRVPAGKDEMTQHALPFRISDTPIAVVGNLNVDYRTSPIPAGPGVMSDGETSLGQIVETIGGGGANTAAAAAALGGRVHLVAAVGNDSLGHRLEEHLMRIGITPHLARKAAPTGRSIALTWDNHHRHFLSCLPSSALLTEADVDLHGLWTAGCRHLYRADVWFAPSMLESGNLQLLREAQSLGMETSIDINWDPLWSTNDSRAIASRIEALAGTLPHVSFAHANERELCRASGQEEPSQAARWLLERGAGAVIVHRGPRGCAGFTRAGEIIKIPARPVAKRVNETGTGDVFTAAFLLLSELSLHDRLEACAEVAARYLEGSLDLLARLE